LTPRLELSARLAARFSGNSLANAPYVATLTYLTQGRVQYRFAQRFDFAAEMRAMFQPQSGTANRSYGSELGYWPLPDLRLAVGYNLTSSIEPNRAATNGARRGFYFNISTKLSNLFNLFGTPSKSSQTTSDALVANELKAEPK
jgi:hypothetical protein